jgi:hypothetical protein
MSHQPLHSSLTAMKKFLILLLATASSLALAAEPPANSELVLEDSFDREELGKGWSVNTGEWTIVDGVLRIREIPADKHSAAVRRVLATRNAVYELRFRFVEKGKGFHLGFDPAKGELDKKGHLFSVMIMPKGWKIMKHVDKAKPKDDPNLVLAEQKTAFESGEWYTLRVTSWATYVTAMIEGKETLKGSHPSFGVKKPTLVFRGLGDGVEVDDLKVWVPKVK